MSKVNIKVVHITRVEGHGNIVAALDEGRIEEVMFQVVEAIRFFEGILRGRSWEEVGHIARGSAASARSATAVRRCKAPRRLWG